MGGKTQKAVILTDFCFCLAGSRDCQEGGTGRRGEGTQAGQGARKEPGQGGGAGRRGEITGMRVSDRQSRRWGTPCHGALRGGWHGAGDWLSAQWSWGHSFRAYPLGHRTEQEGCQLLIWCPAPAPRHAKLPVLRVPVTVLLPGGPTQPQAEQTRVTSAPFHSGWGRLGPAELSEKARSPAPDPAW